MLLSDAAEILLKSRCAECFFKLCRLVFVEAALKAPKQQCAELIAVQLC